MLAEQLGKTVSPPNNLEHLFDIKALGEVLFETVTDVRADVAVIVPLYNYAKYIEECLASVVNQDIDAISVIVVDDHSSDDGSRVAINFLQQTHRRFSTARVIRQRRNLGLDMSRNAGILWSSEPLLFMLDADNRIRRSALPRLRSAIANAERGSPIHNSLFLESAPASAWRTSGHRRSFRSVTRSMRWRC